MFITYEQIQISKYLRPWRIQEYIHTIVYPNTTYQWQIPWLDHILFGMYRTKVHVLHESNQQGLHGLLDG